MEIIMGDKQQAITAILEKATKIAGNANLEGSMKFGRPSIGTVNGEYTGRDKVRKEATDQMIKYIKEVENLGVPRETATQLMAALGDVEQGKLTVAHLESEAAKEGVVAQFAANYLGASNTWTTRANTANETLRDAEDVLKSLTEKAVEAANKAPAKTSPEALKGAMENSKDVKATGGTFTPAKPPSAIEKTR